jgi:hypothetical protein
VVSFLAQTETSCQGLIPLPWGLSCVIAQKTLEPMSPLLALARSVRDAIKKKLRNKKSQKNQKKASLLYLT